VRTDSGWRIVKASYEWNLDAQRRKIVREAKKRQAKAKEEGKPFDLEVYVEDRLDQVTAERYGLAETKSLLRLVRAICHVRQAYRREEMALPFVVVRTELAPDYSDPAVRHALAQKALTSGADIFGPTAADTPGTTLRDVAVEAQVVERLAAEPDFTDAEADAEEVAVIEEPIPDNGSGAPTLLSGEDDASEVLSEDHEEPEDEPTDAVYCDDCGATLPANVVAYCQGPRGRETFGGNNYCFKCQRKRRAAVKEAGAR